MLANFTTEMNPANNSFTKLNGNSTLVPERVNFVVNTIALLISLFTIISNTLILVVLFRSKQLRQKTYIVLVLSMCFTDLLVGISGILFVTIHFSRLHSPELCFLQLYFFTTGIAASLGQTLLICVNRLLSAWNIHYNDTIFAGNRKYILTFCCWVIIHIYSSWGSAFINDTVTECSITTIIGAKYEIYVFSLSCLYIVLLFLTVTLYLFTLAKIRKRLLNINVAFENGDDGISTTSSAPHTQNTSVNYKNAVRVTRTVGIIIFVLTTMTGPYIAMSFLLSITHVNRIWRVLTSILATINSVINPLIYSWRFRELRHELKKICTCFQKCHKS